MKQSAAACELQEDIKLASCDRNHTASRFFDCDAMVTLVLSVRCFFDTRAELVPSTGALRLLVIAMAAGSHATRRHARAFRPPEYRLSSCYRPLSISHRVRLHAS